jgi:hypothetical protein
MSSENYEKLKVEVENLSKSIAQVTADISQDEKFSKEKTVNKEENNGVDDFIDVN